MKTFKIGADEDGYFFIGDIDDNTTFIGEEVYFKSQVDTYIKILEDELKQVQTIGVEMQREANRKLSEENKKLKEALVKIKSVDGESDYAIEKVQIIAIEALKDPNGK